ncbi:MAG: putative phage abortive infection protein [Cognatishimia activa]
MPRSLSTFIVFAIFVFIFCLWWGDIVVEVGRAFGVTEEAVSLGDWGDAFAPLNTLFSGLAFLGVAATVILQSSTSKRTQIEVGKSEFERTFFQVFGLIRELRSELRFVQKGRPGLSLHGGASKFEPNSEKQGIEAIKAAYRETDKAIRDRHSSNGWVDKAMLGKIYNISVNRRHEAEFGPYFRAIYTLLKRIDLCPYLNQAEKLDYSRLLRSQMTSHEAALLGLNGLSPNAKDLMNYLEKYRMLKYSQNGEIRDNLEAIYPKETFQGR